jgi:hypothetical protein
MPKGTISMQPLTQGREANTIGHTNMDDILRSSVLALILFYLVSPSSFYHFFVLAEDQ